MLSGCHWSDLQFLSLFLIMEIKQEPEDSLVEEEIDIEEHFLPNVFDMWNYHQDNNEIIDELKNELVSFKNENCTDPCTDYFQQTCTNYETDQNIYGANANRLRGSVQRKYFKQSKIGRPLNVKNINKQDAINGIIICRVCGNLYLKQIEYLYHYSIHHSLRKKKLYKSQFNRRYTGKLTDLENVKYEIVIVKHELKEELEETKNCSHFKGIDNCNPYLCEIVGNTQLCGNTCKKQFKCHICSKFFPLMRQLNRHIMRKHMNEKPFKCEICAKAFTLKSNLNTHIRSHTDGNICLKYFSQKDRLTDHKEKRLKCDIPLKHFPRKCELNRHEQSHEGEKGFKCDICLKYFASKWGLNRHLRCHTGEKPFKCNICSKSFIEKSRLKKHLLLHADEKSFKCSICSKSFSQKDYLSKHLLCHTGDKPFKCEICLKYFSRKGDLKKHLRCHTGKKPFECNICSKFFTRKSDFNRHLRTLSHSRKTVQK